MPAHFPALRGQVHLLLHNATPMHHAAMYTYRTDAALPYAPCLAVIGHLCVDLPYQQRAHIATFSGAARQVRSLQPGTTSVCHAAAHAYRPASALPYAPCLALIGHVHADLLYQQRARIRTMHACNAHFCPRCAPLRRTCTMRLCTHIESMLLYQMHPTWSQSAHYMPRYSTYSVISRRMCSQIWPSPMHLIALHPYSHSMPAQSAPAHCVQRYCTNSQISLPIMAGLGHFQPKISNRFEAPSSLAPIPLQSRLEPAGPIPLQVLPQSRSRPKQV